MSERAFLLAIIENPDDIVTPLIYADWLDERGDKLGSYIRTLPIEQAFLALIASDMDNLDYQRRYADFLEMSGYCGRADFIRLQLEHIHDQQWTPEELQMMSDFRRVGLAGAIISTNGRGSRSGIENPEYQGGFITLNHDPKIITLLYLYFPSSFAIYRIACCRLG